MRFWFIFFCCISLYAYPQKLEVDITEKTQNEALMSLMENECTSISHLFSDAKFVTTTYQIPAFSLYSSYWDTLHIRSQILQIPFLDNTIKIFLVQNENQPFTFPTSGFLKNTFGLQRDNSFHTGVDYEINVGDPIVACFDGVVRMARNYGDYGNTVVIRHYNGLESVYSHLDIVFVKPGQIVEAGYHIANAGNSGKTSENVLHFEMRFMNECFNPEKMIDNSTRSLASNILELHPEDFTIIALPSVNQTNNSTTSSTETVYHIVKPGETLYRISREYNVHMETIIKLNHLNAKGDNLQAGQRLRIK